MSRKSKIEAEEKVKFVESYLQGTMKCTQAAKEAGIDESTFRYWIMKYKSGGAEALSTHSTNKHYSKEIMLAAVTTYLAGGGSLMEVCEKYHIDSKTPLQNWIRKYNENQELRPTSGGSRRTESRETTREERLAIVQDCLENHRNYGATAIKYQVAYYQVRNWVIRYEKNGIDGLKVRRKKLKKGII